MAGAAPKVFKTRFLFWNMNGKDLSARLSQLCDFYEVTILMLAECKVEPGQILTAINSTKPRYRHHSDGSDVAKVSLFSAMPSRSIEFMNASPRMLVCQVSQRGGQPYLLAAVHLSSKKHQSESSQVMECTAIGADIQDAEQQVGHDRTIIMGDLNMNPFEAGVSGAAGLHAVMDNQIAATKTRTVEGRDYSYFYNPSWGMMGDRTPGPPGSYFYRRAEHICYFWNTFDQVLIRPSLIPALQPGFPKVLDSDGKASFLKSDGTPDAKSGSDHLPLLLEMML